MRGEKKQPRPSPLVLKSADIDVLTTCRRGQRPLDEGRVPHEVEARLGGPVCRASGKAVGQCALGLAQHADAVVAAHVQQEYGIRIPDDAIEEMPTPRAAVEYLNRRFAGEPSR